MMYIVSHRARRFGWFVPLLALMLVTARAAAQGGPLVQWGDTTHGQANNAPPAAGPYMAISAGVYHSLALKTDGSLVQWGETGLGEANNAPPSAGPYIAIAAGGYHNLALKADGSLVQWGATNGGQATNAPPAAGPYIAIAAGEYHSLALKADGSLVQWGATSYGQGTNAPPSAGPYITIAAGGSHNLALKADGSLVQWGDTAFGQANNLPPNAGPYIVISAGIAHSLALKADGSLVQWGRTSEGQATNAPPVAGPYIAVAASYTYNIALKADGSLVRWGATNQGEANNAPPADGPYIAIASKSSHTLALQGAPRPTVSFTYQGRLTGQSGPVDLRFTIFNASTGGTQVGAVTAANSVTPDAQGVFTAQVRPGSIDASRTLWMEIRVAPAGSGVLTTLTPRVPISAAPIAAFASIAGTAAIASAATTAGSVPWSGITGVPANVGNAYSPWNAGSSSINYTSGNVGIGTTTPARLLDVNGPARINGPIQNSPTPVVTNDMGLYSSGVGNWIRLVTNNAPIQFYTVYSDGAASTSPAQMILAANGNLGIGTGSPSQRLTVNGNVLANNVAVPSSIRFKDHVSTMDDALALLLKLEGVRFDWKPEWAKERPGREHDIGFVAEDVAKIFPEVVFYDEQGKVTGMDYSRLTAVAVQAIKQQQAQRNADKERYDSELSRLRDEVSRRAAENDELRARLERLEQRLR